MRVCVCVRLFYDNVDSNLKHVAQVRPEPALGSLQVRWNQRQAHQLWPAAASAEPCSVSGGFCGDDLDSLPDPRAIQREVKGRLAAAAKGVFTKRKRCVDPGDSAGLCKLTFLRSRLGAIRYII